MARKDDTDSCPKCGAMRPQNALECLNCGVIFDKLSEAGKSQPAASAGAAPGPIGAKSVAMLANSSLVEKIKAKWPVILLLIWMMLISLFMIDINSKLARQTNQIEIAASLLESLQISQSSMDTSLLHIQRKLNALEIETQNINTRLERK